MKAFVCNVLSAYAILLLSNSLLNIRLLVESACSCCLRTADPCKCPKVRLGHFPSECGHPISNLTLLTRNPYIYVQAPIRMSPGLYTVLLLDTEIYNPPIRWIKAHLVMVSWNIQYECLLNPDGCQLKEYLQTKTANCSDQFDRFDPLRLVLLRQRQEMSGSFWEQYDTSQVNRVLAYADLYRSPILQFPPVRMSEYQVHYCLHDPIYHEYLITRDFESYETGCQFDPSSQSTLQNPLVNEFPRISITQIQVNEELNDCYIKRDWIQQPKRARSENRQRVRDCPLDLIAFVRKMNGSVARDRFIQHMHKRAEEWLWMSKLEYMHLMGIKHSSDVYSNHEVGFDIHAVFCGSFLKQKKKTTFCVIRAEAYRQILMELGVRWYSEN
ncbi:unnamed protein product [Echinostoma caproni]|uniref:Uncharacterized protein n=1 Tax=Echinostoma caproni TaxID=27848 RepID=A0A183AE69_9TREM|nr:unnamed protein product [Echinostoma caproni]